MTNSAEPTQRQHRLCAIAVLLRVLFACLSSCHSTTLIQGKKTDLGAEFVYEQTLDKKDAGNYDYHYRGEHKGVHTSGDGKLAVIATDGKLTMKAAELNSGKSQVYLYGAKGVDAEAGEIVEHTISARESKQRGFLKRSHTRDYESWEAHQVKTSDITGDSVALVADRGDINAVGSNIVGEHGALLQTRQGDITLKAGENTYHSEERHSKHKVGLMGSGGIGVTLGSRSQSSDNTLDLKGHTATVVGAIDGNVTIDAGGHYREQGAIVHAGRAGGPLTKEQWLALSPAERNRAGNVYLNAQSAELDVMRGEQKQEMNSRYKQTGITVNLSGALVNAAQMARKNLQHLGKSDNARVKAMAAANAAWSGYKAVQAVNEAVQSGSGGTLINLSISGGSQHSSSHQRSREDILQSSQLTGDSGVYLNIRGKGAGSTLNITGSDLGGSAVTMLNVEGKKTFQAAETRREIHSDQHSGGGGGGIALQGGSNGGGLGITANANIGKGETNGQSTTYRLSHIGGLSGHTDIGDGKTLLNGAQILGKSIEGNTRDLEIHSPQGTMDYQSRQNALSGNVLYGYGVSVNLDYQNTRVDAHEKTVNIDSGQRDAVRGVQESGNNRIQALTGSIKQNDALANSGQDKTGGVSGFYAGDDGYRIHNTGTTVLGGLITSTAKAEAEGKNHFSTDRLVREEIHNYSNYKGKSIALGVSAVLSGDTLEQGEAQRREFMDVGKSGVGKTFGIGREQRSQEGVTIGSVNTANLTIGDDAGQRLLTGESAAEAAKNANRGITLEHVKERNGTTSVSFDADKVTRDITSTAQVMQGFDGTTQGIKHDLRKQADAYRERGDEETAAKLDKLAIGADMLKGGLTPTDSALGTIANTAAPLVSYQIGQYAKAHGSEGSAGHIAAHAALAALTSAANGGSGTDIATSAAITGAAEYSAPLVAKGFYGTSDSSKLTAEQKETISNILGLAAAGTGAAVGNSTTAYGASRAVGNAVEDNALGPESFARRQRDRQIIDGKMLGDIPLNSTAEQLLADEQADQRSEYLAEKNRKGTLSKDETAEFLGYLAQIHKEYENEYGKNIADSIIKDFIDHKDPFRPDSYPYAGNRTEQHEWYERNKDNPYYYPKNYLDRFNLGWLIREKTKTEEERIFNKAARIKGQNLVLERDTNQYGGSAVYGLAGGTGSLPVAIRAATVAHGTAQTVVGISNNDGEQALWGMFELMGAVGGNAAGYKIAVKKTDPGIIPHQIMGNESGYVAGSAKYRPVPNELQNKFAPPQNNRLKHDSNGNIVGNKGGKIEQTNLVDDGFNPVYKDSAGHHFKINPKNGNYEYISSWEISGKITDIQLSRQIHEAAVNRSASFFEQQGVKVTTGITLRNTLTQEKAVLDQLISGGAPGAKMPVPPGFKAIDLKTGKEVTHIKFDKNGNIGIENKTGGAGLERNQSSIYQNCVMGTGCIKSVGRKAQEAELRKGVVPEEIYILRSD